MLNRTNRTLSANLNRLNLGTRSLATQANGFNGKVTLRVLPTFGDSPRDGVSGSDHAMSIRHSSIRLPEIPYSSPADPWRLERREFEPVVAVPVEVLHLAVLLVGQSAQYPSGGMYQAQTQAPASTPPAEANAITGGAMKRSTKPSSRKSLDLGCARVRVARPAAAFVAAAGG